MTFYDHQISTESFMFVCLLWMNIIIFFMYKKELQHISNILLCLHLLMISEHTNLNSPIMLAKPQTCVEKLFNIRNI